MTRPDGEVKPMDAASAQTVITWVYPEPYSFYNMNPTSGLHEELLGGQYYAVYAEGLVGYACYGSSAQVVCGASRSCYGERGFLDVGLGMKPEICG